MLFVCSCWCLFCFFTDTATTEIDTYVPTLSLHYSLPICRRDLREVDGVDAGHAGGAASAVRAGQLRDRAVAGGDVEHAPPAAERSEAVEPEALDAAGVVAAERAGQRMQDVLLPVPRPCGLAMRGGGGVVRARRGIGGKKRGARRPL